MESILHSPPIRWLLQAKRIPLLFSVTVVAGIFYHYAPNLTAVWILLTLLLQAGLFKLFDFVKKHNLLGGVLYVAVGFVFLMLARFLIQEGGGGNFAPEDLNLRISFFVWFLTPQSVLTITYYAYTFALYLLFTFFIASVAYYFTFVRYRVLMSFLVMIFPFAIYAKENETMPIPSIIILLVCYFAVMIYCRQARAEDASVVQPLTAGGENTLHQPAKNSAYADLKPELLDGSFLKASGLFLAAAGILVLVMPKPQVKADRAFLDSMLDMSKLSDYLMNAISGFTDSSDGGNYNLTYSRTLYYARAAEPLNLRVRTFSHYDYDEDTWNAGDFDAYPEQRDSRYRRVNGFHTMSTEQSPADLVAVLQYAAQESPAFAKKWHLEQLAHTQFSAADYRKTMEIQPAAFATMVAPSPSHSFRASRGGAKPNPMYQSENGVIFSYIAAPRASTPTYTIEYVSETVSSSEAARILLQTCEKQTWAELLLDLQDAVAGTEQAQVAQDAITCYLNALTYTQHIKTQTTEEVYALAMELTANRKTDFEKAEAIYNYLKYGDFVYSLEFPITEQDNVETFLFQNKTGVCYQFATAMAELCRAAGLPTRYVEGYAMSQPDERLAGGGNWDYVITTDHGHAFVEVYLAGYGWMMLDATAGTVMESPRLKGNVISTLQFSGLILFGTAVLLILLLVWIIPTAEEWWFRRWYRKRMDGMAVQKAFVRLRKQWKANPAETARVLCAAQGDFLQLDLTPLLEGFEETLYADRCSPETAERVYRVYCAAHDAYPSAVRRKRKEARAARKMTKKKTA